jgi:hypothetical protein
LSNITETDEIGRQFFLQEPSLTFDGDKIIVVGVGGSFLFYQRKKENFRVENQTRRERDTHFIAARNFRVTNDLLIERF